MKGRVLLTVLGYGLRWLFEAAGFAGEVVEGVVEGALGAGPGVWRKGCGCRLGSWLRLGDWMGRRARKGCAGRCGR
jgi:hypothetical protein